MDLCGSVHPACGLRSYAWPGCAQCSRAIAHIIVAKQTCLSLVTYHNPLAALCLCIHGKGLLPYMVCSCGLLHVMAGCL